MDAIEPVKVAMPASKRTTRFLKSPFKGGQKKKQRREGSNEGGKMVRIMSTVDRFYA